MAKRMRFDSNNKEQSSSEISQEEDDEVCSPGLLSNENERHMQMSYRKPKCYSKNALMARENRLKKKLYVTNLEKEISKLRSENKNMNIVVQNQSQQLFDLRKQIKYFKSVIANIHVIGNLVRNINSATGMSVSSSLDKRLSLENCNSKGDITEQTSLSSESCPILISDVLLNEPKDVDYSKNLNTPAVNVDDFSQLYFSDRPFNSMELEEEHSYTAKTYSVDSEDDNVGVCLHVSKHNISLEFCSDCNENAKTSLDY